MDTLKLISSIEFGRVIAEALALNQTTTGRSILEKYSTITMNSPITCALVNNFINESKQHLYDNGIKYAVDNVVGVLNENQYSWALMTICENINNNTSKFNNFNRTAAKQVYSLLEGRDEQEVVKYIKAGALKNVMFCEGIRNVVKNIYKEQPVLLETQNFKVEHPVSYVEKSNDKIYFTAEGKIYSIDANNSITESKDANDTTYEFKMINRTLNEMKFDGDSFSYTIKGKLSNIEYQVNEANIITRLTDDEEKVMTVEECREHNRLFINTINPAFKTEVANTLECICKIAEKFEDIAILEEVSMINTKNHMFSVVEGADSVVVSLHKSNNTLPYTKVFTSIVEALNDIKNIMKVDLTQVFESSIEKELENNKIQEEKAIKESLAISEKQSYKNRIELLIEKYKNDPATLAVLSALSEELK